MFQRSGPAGGPLGKQGETRTGPGQRLASRDRRNGLKVAQRELTESRSSKLCMMASGTGDVSVSVGSGLFARVSGVHRCGSVWSCPLCAPVVRQGRAAEIEAGVSAVRARGGSVLFVTATGPHRRGDALGPLLGLTAGFGDVTMRGARAQALRERLGYLGMIRALDVTYGANGWHPHVHALFMFDRELSTDEVAELRSFLFGRWGRALQRRGFGELHPVHGLEVSSSFDAASVSAYVSGVKGEGGLGMELARSDLKARGRTPFDLLGDWAFSGDVQARELWREYEAATFRRRCIQWSPGLRQRLGLLEPEKSDQELAAAEGDDDVLVSVAFPAVQWNAWCRSGEVAAVLRQVEEVAALFLFLAQVGSS